MSVNVDEEYAMNMDDEDEEDNELEPDDEYAMTNEDAIIEPEVSLDSLDAIIVKISQYVSKTSISTVQLRQSLFEEKLRSLCSAKGVIFENIILASNTEDVAYNGLLKALYPALEKHLSKALDERNRSLLIELLGLALTQLDSEPSKSTTVVSHPDIEDDFDEEEDLDPELEANTARVMTVYKDLFEVGFELQIPYGILVKEGALRLRKNKTHLKESTSLSRMYELINDITNKFLIQSEIGSETDAKNLRDVKMRRGTTYYPEFQLGNLFGVLEDARVDSWADLSRNIEPEIKRNIKANLDAGRDITQIVDALTTCIVISEFNPKTAIRLRINVGNSLINKNVFEREYANRKSAFMAGIGELYHLDVSKTGVLEVIIVFNQSAFNGRPLFAYEAVQNLLARGRRPSLRNVILGQDTSGKILTENLDTQQACIILVGAGQRSGKGVLTLNLLGTILAEGAPLIYLDGKPDMAPVLWNVGKKYGVNPAAWDLFDNNGNSTGNGAPERLITENPGIFGLLMYFKALQLMMVSASLQAKGVDFLQGKRPFFIFDEAFAVQMTMSATWQKIVDIAKDKNSDPDEREWCTRIVKWGESLDSDLPAVINSQLPKSGISTIWLFQSMQPTSWNQYAVSGLGSSKLNIMKKPIESRLSIKFLGRGTADSEYALGSAKVKESKLISNRVLSEGGRHFAKTGNQKITDMDSVTVFKPYLVLNESENGTKSAEELKSNVSPEVLKVIAPNGELNAGAGFEGFASIIGSDAIQNLSQGRAYLEAVLATIGVMQNYASVDDYLYDASMDSFKTLGELVNSRSESTDEDESIYSSGNLAVLDGEDEEPVQTTRNTTSNEDIELGDDDYYQPDHYSDDGNVNFSNDTDVEPTLSVPPIQRASTHIQPSKDLGYSAVYENPINLVENPFKMYGTRENSISAINSIRKMSQIILTEIRKFSGDLSRVEQFEVTTNGLVINNIAFRPRFEPDVIESMPFDIRTQVERGNLVELFHFENLRKFPNLSVLRIDNSRLAEGRVRRELGLSPTKTWMKLFDKFRHLHELYIGGERITDAVSAKGYEDRGQGGYSLTEKLREKLGVGRSLISNSRMERVWDSKPVRVFGGAMGWTAGIKVVSLAATLLGPWGIVFGILAGAGVYKEMRNRRS